MENRKYMKVGLGATAVCLFLLVLLFLRGAWDAVQAGGGVGNGGVYLPLIVKPFPYLTSLVSVSSEGIPGNGPSYSPSISANGRYVAFVSEATNLVNNDTNGSWDVFVHDQQLGETIRVSVASDGTEGNRNSYWASISADGRYIVFHSIADNLIGNDTNVNMDVFVHDRQTSETSLISVNVYGTQGNGSNEFPVISADGRYVAFMSDAYNLVSNDMNSTTDVFVHDRLSGAIRRVSIASDGTEANSYSYLPAISADGRFVAFRSHANNLVSDDTNGSSDIFVHDLQTGQTSRVSVASDGTQGNNDSDAPYISADGRYVAFRSEADNLVSDDTNGWSDVFIHDQETGQTSRVSVASDGTQGNANAYSSSISSDGRYVVFDTEADNLANIDTNAAFDVFIHDRQTGQSSRVSVATNGLEGNSGSRGSSISSDGRYIAFYSYASNLVSSDTNGVQDIFVHDRGE